MFAAIGRAGPGALQQVFFRQSPLLHASKLFCVRIPPVPGVVKSIHTQRAGSDVCRAGSTLWSENAPRKTGLRRALHHPDSGKTTLHGDVADRRPQAHRGPRATSTPKAIGRCHASAINCERGELFLRACSRRRGASALYAASIPNCCLTGAVDGDAMYSSSARPNSGRPHPGDTPPENKVMV